MIEIRSLGNIETSTNTRLTIKKKFTESKFNA